MRWLRKQSTKKARDAAVSDAAAWFDEADLSLINFDKRYEAWRWMDIQKSDVLRWKEIGGRFAQRGWCIASLNADGYTREAAVHELGQHPHAEAMPFVLWANKDWVAMVRSTARDATANMLRPGLADALFAQHRLLDQLRNARRADLSGLIDQAFAVLRSSSCRATTRAALNKPCTSDRLFAARVLLDDLREDRSLQQQLVEDRDPVIRRWFTQYLPRLKPEDRLALSRRLVHDRSTVVVRQCLWAMEDATRNALREDILHLCSHDSRGLRASARSIMPDWTRKQFAEHYRKRLGDHNTTAPGDLGGLVETGGAEDLEYFLRFTDAPRSRVRLEALRGVARYDRDNASPYLLKHLSDTNGRVRRFAGDCLTSELTHDESEALFQALTQTPDTRAGEGAYRVLASRPGWQAVPAIFVGMCNASDEKRAAAFDKGYAWWRQYGRAGWLKPSAQCLEQLQRAWQQYDAAGRPQPNSYAYDYAWPLLLDWVKSFVVDGAS